MASASEIYHQAIQALANEAVGEGKLDTPGGTAFLDNPLCGDCVDMQVAVQDGVIAAVAHKVRGCLLCRAAASLIGKHAPGSTPQELEAVGAAVEDFLRRSGPVPDRWQELELFTPVRGHASRYTCVELPFRALLAASHAAAPQG
jgi:NifU-like protein involved in Fe-S cluster formation